MFEILFSFYKISDKYHHFPVYAPANRITSDFTSEIMKIKGWSALNNLGVISASPIPQSISDSPDEADETFVPYSPTDIDVF